MPRLRSLVPVLLVAAGACQLWDPLDQPGLGMLFVPADTALYVGASLTATGKMVNSYGDVYPSEHIRYVGLDPSVSVTLAGKITGISYGRARIVATRERFVDTGFVSVVPTGSLALTSLSSVDVTNVDGSAYMPVASTGQGLGEAAAWVPGRDSVVYSFGIPGGAGSADLYLADLVGNRRLLASRGRDPQVTEDRDWVYFSGANTIERIHLNGTGREIVVPTTVAHPDPSPDGTELAFIHVPLPPGGGFEIKIRTLGDSTERLLTSDGMRPRWSPDGARIAFWRGDYQTGRGAIYIMDPDGSNMKQVSLLGRVYRSNALDWSPDGQWLVARGEEALELIHVSTGLALPLGYTPNHPAAAWRR